MSPVATALASIIIWKLVVPLFPFGDVAVNAIVVVEQRGMAVASFQEIGSPPLGTFEVRCSLLPPGIRWDEFARSELR